MKNIKTKDTTRGKEHYRPLSLMNIDVKRPSEILEISIQWCMKSIIHDQTESTLRMPGHFNVKKKCTDVFFHIKEMKDKQWSSPYMTEKSFDNIKHPLMVRTSGNLRT